MIFILYKAIDKSYLLHVKTLITPKVYIQQVCYKPLICKIGIINVNSIFHCDSTILVQVIISS